MSTLNSLVKALPVLVASALVVPVFTPTVAFGQQMTTLDNFGGRTINRTIWDGRSGRNKLDASRLVRGGKLRLMTRNYGLLDTNEGRGHSGYGLFLKDDLVRKMDAFGVRVRMTGLKMKSCPANPEPSRARIRATGYWLSDGPDSTTDRWDGTNKVLAYIALERRGDEDTNLFRAKYWTGLCADRECSSAIDIAGGDFEKKIRLRQWQTLRIEHRFDDREITFSAGREAHTHSYASIVSNPTKIETAPNIRIDLVSEVPNCVTSSRRRPFLELTGEVDQALINPSALN